MSIFSGIVKPWEILSKALPNSEVDDFEFGMQVDELFKAQQAIDTRKSRRYLRGVASTPAKDLQDEEVIQKGMDLRYFLKHGYLNDDHKPGHEHKLGRPTRALIKTVKDYHGKNVMGLWLEGYIWPEGFHPGADAVWRLGKSLEASGDDHRIGFSIQGKVLKRDGKRILKAWIQDVAITASPVNTATWLEFCDDMSKSQWANIQDVEDIRKSIGDTTFKDTSFTDDEWEEHQKAMTAAGNPLKVESLEEDMKLQTYSPRQMNSFINQDKQKNNQNDEINKSINFAYSEFRKRGYSEGKSRSAALAVAARQLLS